eukprot:m.266513 g.266513  ORF g.266513 m.266513 type:complete len:68 (+) comp16036_c0_seq30:2637-2840(+)
MGAAFPSSESEKGFQYTLCQSASARPACSKKTARASSIFSGRSSDHVRGKASSLDCRMVPCFVDDQL